MAKHVTVIVLIRGHETTHRGPTLAAALKAAERSRLQKGCHIKWQRRLEKLSRVAGGNGTILCGGEETGSAMFLAMRHNPKGFRPTRLELERSTLQPATAKMLRRRRAARLR